MGEYAHKYPGSGILEGVNWARIPKDYTGLVCYYDIWAWYQNGKYNDLGREAPEGVGGAWFFRGRIRTTKEHFKQLYEVYGNYYPELEQWILAGLLSS